MAFDLSVVLDNWGLFVRGAWLTIVISVISVAAGFLISVPVALMGLSHRRVLRWLATAYVEWFRNIPFIVVVYLFFYGLPFAGIRLAEAVVGTIALACFASSYFAEIVRGSILAVPRGQMEAARAIGMSYFQGMWEIVAPQTLRLLLPPTANTSITMLKETSVLSVITVAELTYQGLVVQGNNFAPLRGLPHHRRDLLGDHSNVRSRHASRREGIGSSSGRAPDAAEPRGQIPARRHAEASMTAPLLRVTNLAKRFGAAAALKDISFEVSAGEVVCIIGPSGCGKSTLLRCINHLTEPDEGFVEVAGAYIGRERKADGSIRMQSPREVDRLRPKMGFVFQQFNLWPHLNVLENIVKGPVKVQKRPRTEAEAQARTLLRRFGLEDKADLFPSSLSGGQKQRLWLSLARWRWGRS